MIIYEKERKKRKKWEFVIKFWFFGIILCIIDYNKNVSDNGKGQGYYEIKFELLLNKTYSTK